MAEKKGAAARKEEVVTREYTINLHKRLHGWYPSRHLAGVCCAFSLGDAARSRGSCRSI